MHAERSTISSTSSYPGKYRLVDLQPSINIQTLKFRDYAKWQRLPEQEAQQLSQLDYWVQELRGSVPADFPTDFPRPQTLTYNAGLKKFRINSVVGAQVERVGKSLGLTPFMVLFAGFRLLHYRMSGLEDATIGTLNGNRSREEIEGRTFLYQSIFLLILRRDITIVVGFFVDTQALRIPIQDSLPFSAVLRVTRDVVTRAFANQDVSFDKIVGALHPTRNLSKNPLVQVIFAVHAFTYDFSGVLDGVTTKATDPDPTTRMDLELHIYQQENGEYEGQLLFNSALYSPIWADHLCTSYVELIEVALSNLDLEVSNLSFPSAERGFTSLSPLSSSTTSYPKESTVIDLLREIINEHPTVLAIVDSTISMSYRELDVASDHVAHAIIQTLGSPAPETRIGIFAERSALNVVAMYGTLKAGLAYVPLDPALPEARLQELLNDTLGPMVIIQCTSQITPGIDTSHCTVLKIEDILKSPPMTTSSTANWLPITPRSLAYIMYTSGSTGKPKGALVTHTFSTTK